MAITFGGLATGMDTGSLIQQLMQLERLPIDRLENEKNYLNSRLSAFKDFDSKLADLQTAAEDIDTAAELRSYSAKVGGGEDGNGDYYNASASSTATAGTYEIEVVSLAKQEKEVATGVADVDTWTDTSTTGLTLTVGAEAPVIVATNGLTLTEIAQAINDSAANVSATIINDGDAAVPYRLVITADNAGEAVTIVEDSTLTFSETQTGSQAHIKIDNIDVYGTSNTITDSISGITITLNKENAADETTLLAVGQDNDAIKTKIENFVSKYNDVITFITAQADSSWGRDQALSSTKRRLQNMLVTNVGTTGAYNYLTELGLTTDQKLGTIKIDSTDLTDAITNNFEDVEKLIVGETGVDGISTIFKDYLDAITDNIDGLYASRKDTTDDGLRRIDQSIIRQELRLEKREKSLQAQFSALEELVSAMNTQSAFLTQQLSNLSTIGSK